MRALVGATLCTFLLLGGCSKSDDDNKTTGSLIDNAKSTVNAAAEKAGDLTSDAVDATRQAGETAADMATDTYEAAKTAGKTAIDEASDLAAVETGKASDAATDNASKAVEDAGGMPGQ